MSDCPNCQLHRAQSEARGRMLTKLRAHVAEVEKERHRLRSAISMLRIFTERVHTMDLGPWRMDPPEVVEERARHNAAAALRQDPDGTYWPDLDVGRR